MSSTCKIITNRISRKYHHQGFPYIPLKRTHKYDQINLNSGLPKLNIKNNCHLLCTPVSNIINAVLIIGTYPKLWKAAEVMPTKQTKTPTQFKDMRPISLLFHLGKVTEKVMAQHGLSYRHCPINLHTRHCWE